MKSNRRIVITGCGAVCGSGLSPEAIFSAVLSGQSSIGGISGWDTQGWPARLAAEVNGVDNRTLVDDRKLHKTISRTDLFGLYAADRAVQSSGLAAYRRSLPAGAQPGFDDRSGVFAGSGGGNYRSNYDFFPLLNTAAGDMHRFGQELSVTVNPIWLLKILPNNVVCHVGIRHQFKGTNACITNQCVGGLMAVAEASAALQVEEADRALAVGHDTPMEPETVFHYHRLGLMSVDGLRPFDRQRNGTLFGEGAAALMLEDLTEARSRGSEILGEILGTGCTTEATGILAIRDDGDGMRRAIRLALAEARLTEQDVGMIVAHGNGSPASDASEALAIRGVFGDDIPPVTAFKWCYGHLIAASGVIDLVMALLSLKGRTVPGIMTLGELDPALPPLPVSRQPQTPRQDVALILCRGFAAMNVALLVRGGSSIAPP